MLAGPNGIETTLQGAYAQIVKLGLLVFVERFNMPDFSSDEYRVTSTFVENGGKTTLTTTSPALKHGKS